MEQDCGIRFLVATDVHLGHRQKHPVRYNDSYQGFEEVIEHAKAQNVDFLLLGGDLFDEVNPSKECFFRCLSILKQNVFGYKHVGLKVSLNGQPFISNLESQDLNVSLPIFTIHGNHDYPTNEFGKISACDLLQASNYVNYFGKHLNLHNIVIKPLIINKAGSKTKIALYGLGYIKDQILNQIFEENKIVFQKPIGDIKQYINIFVFHQNRYKKGFRAGAPMHQSFNPRNIPQWMNLVIWGHEHEAIYKLQYEFDRPVYQPGSTVLTSYIETQSYKKQCVLINTRGNNYEIQSILLQKSFRPMKCMSYEYKNIKSEYGEQTDLFEFLDKVIEKLIGQCSQVNKKKPIIRLKVQCSGVADMMKARLIQTKYSHLVANGDKILLFWRRKVQKQSKIEDSQIINKIKNKQIQKSLNSISDELEGIMASACSKIQPNIFVKKNLLQVVNYLGKADSLSAVDIVKKKCSEMQRRRLQGIQKSLLNMSRQKQGEFKKSLKYHFDKKQLYSNNKLDNKFYKINTKQDFISMRDQFTNQNKFMMNCKIMQEFNKTDQLPINQQNSKQTTSFHSSKQSALQRVKIEQSDKDSSVQIVQRSDSEDCCERAAKSNYDEIGNKYKFFEAEEKVQKLAKNKSKKSAITVAGKPNNVVSDKKVMKNVRFSSDFM